MLGTSPIKLNVALVPSLLPSDPDALRQSVCIVVDVVRATTTLTVLFDRGCERVLIAPGIAQARAARQAPDGSRLLAGESGGVAPEGFDLGNSPAAVAGSDMRGKEIVFATTNGTQALRRCENASLVLAGSLRNAAAVAHAALASVQRMPGRVGADPACRSTRSEASEATLDNYSADIIVVCSGRHGNPAYDDTICAGYIIEALTRAANDAGVECHLLEQAAIAVDLLRYVRSVSSIRDALAHSDAGRAVKSIGLEGDLDFCAAADVSNAVPMLRADSPESDLLLMTDARR